MRTLTELATLKKEVRKRMLIEVLREFPGLTEAELRLALETSKHKIDQEKSMRELGLTWDFEALDKPNNRQEVPVSKAIQERARRHDVHSPIASEQWALRMIEDMAPEIPPDELEGWISVVIDVDRRTPSEMAFFRQHGYFPEWEAGRSEIEIEYFQRHACWPNSNERCSFESASLDGSF